MEEIKKLYCPICKKKAKLKTDSSGNVKIYCPKCKKRDKKTKRLFAAVLKNIRMED